MAMITINGKTYNEAFLKRLVCKICKDQNYPNLENFFYRVTFTKEVEKLNNIPEYDKLKPGHYNGVYMCSRCITELFLEYTEVIQSLEKKFP